MRLFCVSLRTLREISFSHAKPAKEAKDDAKVEVRPACVGEPRPRVAGERVVESVARVAKFWPGEVSV